MVRSVIIIFDITGNLKTELTKLFKAMWEFFCARGNCDQSAVPDVIAAGLNK